MIFTFRVQRNVSGTHEFSVSLNSASLVSPQISLKVLQISEPLSIFETGQSVRSIRCSEMQQILPSVDGEFIVAARYVTEALGITILTYLLYDKLVHRRQRYCR